MPRVTGVPKQTGKKSDGADMETMVVIETVATGEDTTKITGVEKMDTRARDTAAAGTGARGIGTTGIVTTGLAAIGTAAMGVLTKDIWTTDIAAAVTEKGVGMNMDMATGAWTKEPIAVDPGSAATSKILFTGIAALTEDSLEIVVLVQTAGT